MRNSVNSRTGTRQLWVVITLSLVLVLCVGMLLWLVWSEPQDLPASISEEQIAEPESTPSLASQSSTAEPASKNESSAASSQNGGAQSTRPVQQTSAASSSPVQKLQNLTINAPLTHDENASYYNVFINADGVTLKNKLVTGDLVLSEAVGDGTVTLENVVVKGRILVNGAQTVMLRDVTAVSLIAQRGSGTTNYIISGTSTIHQMTAKNQLTLDETGLSSNYAGVKKLTTERGAPMWQQVTLLKGAALEMVTTNEATNLMLESGSSIDAVLANASTHIGGSGTVNQLTICSDEVSYEKAPRNITIEDDYDKPSVQNWAIGETETAVNGGDHSGINTTKLSPPKNLAITAADAADSVILSFNSVSNATGYTIVYTVTDGVTTTNETISASTNSYTLTNTLIGQAGTVVSFKVCAVSTSSRYTTSSYSSICTKTVFTLGVPTGVQLSLNGNKLALTFTAAANAADYSHEAVLSVGGSAVETLTLDAGISSGSFENLTAGQTHTVTVRAIGDSRLALTSAAATATRDVPSLPTASNLDISSAGDDLAVTFTGASEVSNYTVTLRYNGTTLSTLSHSASGDVYTYLFELPAGIETGKAYQAVVTPEGGLTSTTSCTVVQRDEPGNPRITSSALGSVTFAFDAVAGYDYAVVSATQNGVAIPGVTMSNLTATGLITAVGDRFNFSVKTLGDDMLYTDSDAASAVQATVGKLSDPISPTINGDQDSLTLSFSTTNSASAHAVVIQTSTDGGLNWSALSSLELAAGVTQTMLTTPDAGTQIKFSVTAKAANALWVDSNTIESETVTIQQLDQASGLSVVDLDSASGVRFQFDAVPDADSYTVSYTRSVAGSASFGPCNYATAIATAVHLDDGDTMTGFTVAAHAEPDGMYIYVDSSANYTAP